MKRVRGFALLAALAALLALTTGWAADPDPYTPNGYRMADALWGGGSAFHGRMFNTAAGEIYPDIMIASASAQRVFRNTLPSIYNYSQTAHTQVPDSVLPSSVCPTTMCGPNNKWVMWDTPFMLKETKKRDGGYLGFEQEMSGFATGISRMLNETSAIGLAVGYDARKIGGRDGYYLRERGDTFHAALYGGTAIAWFFVDGYVGYSRSWYRTENRVLGYDPSTVHTNKGNFNDNVFSAGLKVSYVCILPSEWRITPSLGFDYTHVRLDSINEHYRDDIHFPLHINKSNYNSFVMPIAVSVNKTFSNNWLSFGGCETLWTPEIRASYVPQFGDKRADATARTLDPRPDYAGKSWKVKSTEIGSYGSVGAGLKLKIRDKFIFAIDYNFSFADKYQNHVLSGTYGVSF